MDEEEVRAAQPDSMPAWYENITLDEAERFITSNLQAAVRNVIAIGYYLKNIRDNGLFREAGCENIWDYAWERFGFSKSTASRYMTRNDRFSWKGNSPILDEKYRDFNKSQLQEMLSLTDSELEQVTPDMTVRQIREIHRPADKSVPYVALPGQIELEDLIDVNPAIFPVAEAQAPSEAYTVSVEDMLGEEVVATSQQIPEAVCENGSESEETAAEIAAEPLSAYGTPNRVYPPDSLIAEEGCEGGNMEEIKLKPCPFCGGEAVVHVNDGVRVICKKCNAMTKCLVDGYSQGMPTGGALKSVVNAWNKRVGLGGE